MSSPTKIDARQAVLRTALGMVGSAANAQLDAILQAIDPELAKLFEDRNILLTDGGNITFTGTQIQFSEILNLHINSQVAGGSPTVISLGSTSQTVADGDMFYAVIDRTTPASTTVTVASSLPTVTSANQEVFLIAKRKDALDGTKRVYFRNGTAISEGESVRLGAAGSGGIQIETGQTIASGGTISLAVAGLQYIPVAGTSGDTVASTTPFGATPPNDGTIIYLEGTDDSNPLVIQNNDATNGCILAGDITLYKYTVLGLVYRSAIGRYVEISRVS